MSENRILTDHIVDGDSANHQLNISVLDNPGHGGACHKYSIDWYDGVLRDENGTSLPNGKRAECNVEFQNGPIKEFGINGVTHEAMLAILIDRLKSFQAGPFACEENKEALESAKHCLWCLQGRTRRRIASGVEGTNQL